MQTYHLLERVGVEIEYMIANASTLEVSPIADLLLRAAAGNDIQVSDVTRGPVTWSNELVAHVIEMKTTDPIVPPQLDEMQLLFSENVCSANALLAAHGARLLPTAMHPWMKPETETKLWPHEYAEVYATFDRLFNCRRHGWANLQSIHLNISFSGDEEFARLHAAVRMLLPILPALAASSPAIDGKLTGLLDNRLEVYRTNSIATPAFAGRVIPEQVWSQQEYQDTILRPVAAEIERLAATDVLEPEFTNARGAIARFERGSLEIRLLDTQECTASDFAIAGIVLDVLKAIIAEKWSSLTDQKAWSIERLEPILLHCIRDADGALISDPDYLRGLGWQKGEKPVSARDLWIHLVRAVAPDQFEQPFLKAYRSRGTLARRIVDRLQSGVNQRSCYQMLADSLRDNTSF
jgi:hypothetical protein